MAERLLAEMDVAERVGQLFIVTFPGDTAPYSGEIADLIVNYRVGGVVLLDKNNNITGYDNPANAPIQVTELINDLQKLAIEGGYTAVSETSPTPESQPTLDPTALTPTITPTPTPPNVPIPLFVAINHEGDGNPFTHIRHGLTEVPNNMTVGATWQPTHAQNVGEWVGRDLSLMGINMLFGPSLDVLENPQPANPGDLGVRTFGGDPYWVGLMGQSYTTGVHLGSNNRVAVVAKHFPGLGSSDRSVNDEVPTVRKSLEQLKQIELAPFFSVTGNATRPESAVDALFVTHIRYQGFQGNIRATTVPVSFDPQALTTLMGLDAFAPWRDRGGVLVSDALGLRSVEHFYDDTEQEFPHRRVAKDAFLAGNDILYLGDFALGEGNHEAELANIKDTLLWFQEKYVTDQSFQQLVDESVLRILRLKLGLYGEDFSLDNATQDPQRIAEVIDSENVGIYDLAQTAVTLISPSPAELTERIASPPGIDDKIVIFTDVRQARQCPTCEPEPVISETAIEERILALYGPSASSQVLPEQIDSFSFTDLDAFLNSGPGPIVPPTVPITPTVESGIDNILPGDEGTPTPIPTPTPPPEYWVQEGLNGVTWIIFALQDVEESSALNDFLALRTDIVRNAKVIVFAYNAPYFLDTTEISKLTAYYGIYSKTKPAIDASVRALFQELPLNGSLPVSVDGIGYDLFAQTQPHPNQVIDLFIVNRNGEIQAPPGNEPLNVSVGDTLRLQTGVILDNNGNHVPDGTVVEFIQQDRIQGLVNIVAEQPTTKGIANLDFVLEARTGQFRITVKAGEANQSTEVNIAIEEEEAQIIIITPTPAPTATPTPTSTPSPTPSPTPVPSPTSTPIPIPTPVPPPEEPGVRILLSQFEMLLAMFTGLIMVAGLALFSSHRRQKNLSQQIGAILWSLAGALIIYNYYTLGLPGTAVLQDLNSWAGIITTLIGGFIGFSLYQLRWRQSNRAREKPT